ncbi:MAG: hypothetical protein IKP97_02440 [Kiritimatiellae bacterium]|nr:hypothetical protein [Kiritimatiellia bacterium]
MTVADYIIDQELKGRSMTTLIELKQAFPDAKNGHIATAIKRLVLAGEVFSPCNGFYVKIPVAYKLHGKVPPFFYIDELMKYLKRPYYVGLLSAASVLGAGHQRAMRDYVVASGARLHLPRLKKAALEFAYRSEIIDSATFVRNGEGGTIRFSNAALTAFDLVRFHSICGGLSNVATVIAELKEQLDFNQSPELLRKIGIVDAQRLGYLLEYPLEDKRLADMLYEGLKGCGRRMTVRLLDQHSPANTLDSGSNRWKIMPNVEVEVEDV